MANFFFLFFSFNPLSFTLFLLPSLFVCLSVCPGEWQVLLYFLFRFHFPIFIHHSVSLFSFFFFLSPTGFLFLMFYDGVLESPVTPMSIHVASILFCTPRSGRFDFSFLFFYFPFPFLLFFFYERDR